MDAKWLGPLLVSRELGKGFYTLAKLDGNKIVTKRINVTHLKVYKRLSQDPSPSVSTSQSPKESSESLLPQSSFLKQSTSSTSPKHCIQLLSPNTAYSCDLKTRIESSLLTTEYRAVLRINFILVISCACGELELLCWHTQQMQMKILMYVQ